MAKKIIFGSQLILLLFLTLLFQGVIEVTSKPIPPLVKFLEPYKGVWNHNVLVTEQNITLPADIVKNATIVYDKRWVPHIYAENLSDVLFLQGYAEAQNRLFQMEFLAKAAAGELSSLLGEVTLEYDLDKRRRGMKYAAENAAQAWEKMPHFHLTKRYIDGINAYIQSLKPEDYPLEYKIFNRKPEPWTVLKSALIFKEMSLTLCGRNEDLPFSNTRNVMDSILFHEWFPEYEDVENPVVPDHVVFNFDSLSGKKQSSSGFITQVLNKSFFETRNPGIGSNQWTVGKAKTKSGANIFCNDPHLSLGLPSIWFEEHLVTPEFNAYGVSFPGFPGIMIGFNEHIAWGETNVGQDVEDLFLIEWADNSRSHYMLDGQKVATDIRIENIEIRGSKVPKTDTVLYTVWGPVYKKSKDGKADLALRWLAHDKPWTEEYLTFVDGMQCRNYEEYLKATEPFITPAQNFGFSSKDGDIAIRINGILPAKYDQDGRFVEYGNSSSNAWQAFIPKTQNPHVVNPPENFVASANQRSTSRKYPYYYTGNFENYRNRTINNYLRKSDNITVEDMKSMQQDAYSAKASDFISVLPQECRNIVGEANINWYNKLKTWNAQYKRDATEPIFFEIFLKHLRKVTFDELREFENTMAMTYPKDWVLFKQIKENPGDLMFNIKKTSTVENATNVQVLAFYQANKEIDSLLQKNPKLTWGTYKPLDIPHLTRMPALSALNISADGCPSAINAKGNSFGPSWRMIVQQSTPIEAYGVFPGGQSGNPFSPYYKNMVDDWTNGKYHPLRGDKSPETLSDIAFVTIQVTPKK